jgi:2,5-diketo-D-gluconate reductase A
MTVIPNLGLNDGRTIPQLGFGVYQVPPEVTAEVVRASLAAGYRHIDTAQMYGNERGVGEAIRSSGLARDDVFVTSKLSNAWHRPDDARRAFDGTLSALGSDHVDLFLIHWPLPTLFDGDYVATWHTLEDIQRDGRARSIGVSNFQVAHLERLAAEAGIVPAVNQVEAHPYFPNDDVRAYGRAHGIVTQAWSPLAQGRAVADATAIEVAARVARTPSQVILRWHIQRGDVVFPKTLSAARMRENLGAFDFELADGDMEQLSALQRGEAGRLGPHPDTFDWIPGHG